MMILKCFIVYKNYKIVYLCINLVINNRLYIYRIFIFIINIVIRGVYRIKVLGKCYKVKYV